jgi:hypothetical protein
MTHRPNGNISVSTTDVLIAMLTSDLRGSWAEGTASQRREHIDPAASSSLPVMAGTEEPEETAPPDAPAS